MAILGDPVKPKHLHNAARLLFRTESMRFRKGAYKHHSMFQTIFKAFWPELATLKASNVFTKPTPAICLLVTEQRYSSYFSPNKLNPLFLEKGQKDESTTLFLKRTLKNNYAKARISTN